MTNGALLRRSMFEKMDAEAILRGSRRPLIIGIGGGGDIVGALATAEAMRLYDGAQPMLGGLTWERLAIDPKPGPRRASEIVNKEVIAAGALLATAATRVRGSAVRFAESRMAEFLNDSTLLIDINEGPATIAAAMEVVIKRFARDLVLLVDVGGDVLAQGDEPGLRSPLCEAVMLAVGLRLLRSSHPVLLGIFGVGCDGELPAATVLDRIELLSSLTGPTGARGLTAPVADRVEAAARLIPTEASLNAIRAFRGEYGVHPMRGGTANAEFTPLSAITYFLPVDVTVNAVGRLARAVMDASDLEAANDALHSLGVITELDLERGEDGRKS